MMLSHSHPTVCAPDACVGCMLCQDICPKGAIRVEKGILSYNAVIDPALCVDCNLCHKMCQVEHPEAVERRAPISWKQGWSSDPVIRANSSSGGIAQAISRAFVEAGGVVCSCVFEEGTFRFALARTQEEAKAFCGSKYVKSDPSGAYQQVKDLLREGTRVLFVGLPCQVGALKVFIPLSLQENLYTIDLLCHGTPSPLLLEKYLEAYKRPLTSLRDIRFRDPQKTAYYLACDERRLVKSETDTYTDAFVLGVSFTENCYTCAYATSERAGDLTLGDSWGSQLPFEERWRGVSLTLVNTPQGEQLLAMAELHLVEVDIERARSHNGTLNHPAKRHPMRQELLSQIEAGASARKQLRRAVPLKTRLKKRVKFLVPTGLRRVIKRMLKG